MFNRNRLSAAIVTVLASAAGTNYVNAQEDAALEEVVVTGIRASAEASMDIKRDSQGVVDAISAEDIGKFPDTNLAESLQRITGVSIDRVNGEGSEVTVRGFGGGNNMVTLNGRYLPSANVNIVGGDQSVDFAQGVSRSFDFSNLASEGVSALEVYKTGRADVASGGIGATINIRTLRPLDDPGLNVSVGGKIVNDRSVVNGDDYTPELSGLVSWTDDDEKFGVSLFASYQVRDAASVSATSNGWNIRTYEDVANPDNGFVSNTTTIVNRPLNPQQLVGVPNDSRWHLAEGTRERMNGMLTLQWRPMESLTVTADALMVENALEEQRSDQTNWFNRPFNVIGFDSDPGVATAIFLQENIGGVKDVGYEQQFRSTKDTLDSVGLNVSFDVTENFNLEFDAHSSEAESAPDGRFGTSSVLVGIGAPVITSHYLDWRRTGFPVQYFTIDDTVRQGVGLDGGTNGNGVLDAGDLGTQMLRTNASWQTTNIDQIKLEGSFETDLFTVSGGLDYIDMEMNQRRTQTQQTLGNWGIENPGDVPEDLMEQYCLACLFHDFEPYATGNANIAFRGNAEDLMEVLQPLYVSRGNAVDITNNEDNTVAEETTAFFVQFFHEGEIADMGYSVNAGLRYEETDVTSTSNITPVTGIDWVSDNDFQRTTGSGIVANSLSSSYDYTLPSLDLSLNVTEDVKLRASYSKTISRVPFGNLFATDTPSAPNRPTALGENPGATSGNPDLLPLESTNLDLSVEWYYAETSYLSAGYFDKTIDNFLGTGIVTRPMFDLRDPSSGEAGSRSGDALEYINSNAAANPSDVNLFTLTALIDNRADLATAIAEFEANLGGDGNVEQGYADGILAQYDIVADANDPLYDFDVATNVNNQEGHIYGWEFALQHFFGDSGFGMMANYTLVDGDVEFDNAGDPSIDQFALLGLSDTANLAGFYENDIFSLRVSYNWRDQFLQSVGRGGANRNPVYFDEYSQIDFNASLAITENVSMTLEGLNVLGENVKSFGRSESQIWYMQELEPRYMLGVRYTY